MEKILAFDLGGTFLVGEVSRKAHRKWFEVMAFLLKDPGVKKLYSKKDYFPDVFRLMERYTGLKKGNDIDKEVMTKFARNMFQMLMLGAVREKKKHALEKGLVAYARELKKKYKLALVTTTPADIVVPILEVLKIDDLFDYTFKSPIHLEPDKMQLLKDFVKALGKPVFYLGNSKEDIGAARSLGIKSILAKWDSHDDVYADYEADSVMDLKRLLEEEFGL